MAESREDSLIEPRRDYTENTLSRDILQPQPVEQFKHWLQAARERKLIDATAMCLSTVDEQGRPHSRIVLLKQFDKNGFIFYSNYDSDKGRELTANNNACLLFYWQALERQVRIEGIVEHHTSADADTYFNSRPDGSRFSAAASKQSRAVNNRAVLEDAVAALRDKHPDGQVPRPANWGGFILTPNRFEFWQGRADRLHDRFIYHSHNASNDQWQVDRLSP